MKKLFTGAVLGMLIHETLGFLFLKRHPQLEEEYYKAIAEEAQNLRSRFAR